MDALLTTIVLWLSVNFALPAIYAHPKIHQVPAIEIAVMRYRAFTPEKRQEIVALYGKQDRSGAARVPLAVYDDASKTIFLPAEWTGSTPAELSVLVHEMVHHLQNATHLRYECPRARESLAYTAQEKWLGLFGSNLLREFEIDPLTLKVSTECAY